MLDCLLRSSALITSTEVNISTYIVCSTFLFFAYVATVTTPCHIVLDFSHFSEQIKPRELTCFPRVKLLTWLSVPDLVALTEAGERASERTHPATGQ
jgi:hypothetical protein